jgi:hypothetical protein
MKVTDYAWRTGMKVFPDSLSEIVACPDARQVRFPSNSKVKRSGHGNDDIAATADPLDQMVHCSDPRQIRLRFR